MVRGLSSRPDLHRNQGLYQLLGIGSRRTRGSVDAQQKNTLYNILKSFLTWFSRLKSKDKEVGYNPFREKTREFTEN